MAHNNKINQANATMTKLIFTGLLSWILALPSLTYGYEVDTHAEMTKQSVQQAEIFKDNGKYFNDLGITNPYSASTQFSNSKSKLYSILDLFAFGAKFEDTATSCIWGTDNCRRVFNHFFDPSRSTNPSDQAFHFRLISNATSPPFLVLDIAEGNPFPSGTPRITRSFTSPDWALEDRIIIDNTQWYAGGQNHSWRDARNNLYLALTSKQEKDRKDNFGLTFQNIGHVVHHLQDMAQPQHVRNDPHNPANDQINPPVHASLFESFTNEHRDDAIVPYISSVGSNPWSPAYLSMDVNNQFNTARQFWVSQGKGIAEFTRNNFFSAGTNYQKTGGYGIPTLSNSAPPPTTLKDACQLIVPSPLPACQPNLLAIAGNTKMTFYPTTINNLRTGVTVTNPYATTESIFNADLNAVTISGEPIYTLNGFNMLYALDYLVPEATAYSTGLINYFFRGKIDMVADPNNPGQYLIKNLGNETLKNGTFELYYDDSTTQTRNIVAAWQTPVNGLIEGGNMSAPFTPPNPVPSSYMLIFKGDMGSENVGMSGGAVAAKKVTITNGTTFGLSGPLGGGGIGSQGLFFSGTGFYSFNLSTGKETPPKANTNQFIGTASAYDPSTNRLYLEQVQSDGVHLKALDPDGTLSEIALLSNPFKIFAINPNTHTLFGLSGPGSGGLDSQGLFFSGTGFSSFNLSTKQEATLSVNTNQFIGTASAYDPSTNRLYLEQVQSDGVHLKALDPDGTLSEIALLSNPFKIFAINPNTHTLFGLSGPGGGGIGSQGLFFSGTGFSSFNLSTGKETPPKANTNQFIGTASAYDPSTNRLYLEQVQSDGVHLKVLDQDGTPSEIALLPNPFVIFGITVH
jgi:hypothetical protein